MQKEIKDQQNRLQELEHKFIKLQKQLTTAGSLEALSLRKERNVVFKEIGKIEERYKYVINKLKDRRAASVEQAKLILNYIETDMTPKEIEYILGKPDDKEYYKPYGKVKIKSMSYGRFLIYFSRSTLVDNIKYKLNNLQMVRLKYRGYNILRDGILCREMGIEWSNIEMSLEAVDEIKKYVLGQ